MISPEAAAALGVATVVLAFAPAVAIAFAPVRERATANLRLLCGVALTVLVMRVGAWAFISVHLRNVAGGAFFVGSLIAMARASRGQGRVGRPWVYGALAAPLVGLLAWAFSASFYRTPAVDLPHVPLGPGTYAVLQGGSSKLTNPFHGKLHELAAVDLMKLEASGNRARRFVPRTLEDYASFGAKVTSPCEGDVVAVENDRPDVAPGADDARSPPVAEGANPGNYVILRCPGGLVKLGHLQHGSVRVAPGARVRAGREVGRIGNSGDGSEPHLHVGTYPEGTTLPQVVDHSGDLPQTFAGQVLVANTVFTIE